MIIENGPYTVYCHTNKTNGKKYVGITKLDPQRRWRRGKGYCTQTYFYKAIQKYGWDGFDHEIIASNLTEDEAQSFEKMLIDVWKLQDKNNGYNIYEGGQVSHIADEARQKMKEAWKHRPPISDETRKKLSAAKKGKKFSEEHRKHMAEAQIGEKNHQYGKPSVWRDVHGKGHPLSMPVNCYDLQGNFVACYESLNDAWRATGISVKCISRVCRHVKYYNTAGGYLWKYASEGDEIADEAV